jgi:uncharacterized protein
MLVGTLRGYRAVLSPMLAAVAGPLGMGCRFTPTCSQYAIEAVRSHGTFKGSALALRRLCRCHPWGGFGPDPVPTAMLPATVRNLSTQETGRAELLLGLDFGAAQQRRPAGFKGARHTSPLPSQLSPLNSSEHGS